VVPHLLNDFRDIVCEIQSILFLNDEVGVTTKVAQTIIEKIELFVGISK
jgi:hypothetical protein